MGSVSRNAWLCTSSHLSSSWAAPNISLLRNTFWPQQCFLSRAGRQASRGQQGFSDDLRTSRLRQWTTHGVQARRTTDRSAAGAELWRSVNSSQQTATKARANSTGVSTRRCCSRQMPPLLYTVKCYWLVERRLALPLRQTDIKGSQI